MIDNLTNMGEISQIQARGNKSYLVFKSGRVMGWPVRSKSGYLQASPVIFDFPKK